MPVIVGAASNYIASWNGVRSELMATSSKVSRFELPPDCTHVAIRPEEGTDAYFVHLFLDPPRGGSTVDESAAGSPLPSGEWSTFPVRKGQKYIGISATATNRALAGATPVVVVQPLIERTGDR